MCTRAVALVDMAEPHASHPRSIEATPESPLDVAMFEI